VLYGTTREFLERLGLPSLDALPSLGDFVPDASVVEALERGLRVNSDPTLEDATLEDAAADDGAALDDAPAPEAPAPDEPAPSD
jgi:segregation and condensation protein B